MKKVIGILSGLLIVAIIIICVLLFTGKSDSEKENTDKGNDNPPVTKEEITITFDTDGGKEVESIKIEKGTSTTLPTTEKEKANFLGWTLEDKIIDDTYIFNEDTELKAKWEAIKEDVKTYTITFDSNGGSKVSKITVECNKTIPSLPTPTKDGYNFISWADKHGKVIGVGALLTCENVTLYANWEKKENTETKKTYTCPTNYKLNGTKCVLEETPKQKCPGDTYEFDNQCITLTSNAQNSDQIVRVCGKTTVVVDNNGHTQEVQGVVKYAGYYYCAYGEVSESQYSCTTHGYKWIDNKCYRTTTGPSENMTFSCKTNAYKYLTTEQANSLRKNSNLSGCFPTTSKIPYCDSDYTLSNNKCVKTIDATVK
jgi:hypothetical protein